MKGRKNVKSYRRNAKRSMSTRRKKKTKTFFPECERKKERKSFFYR